MSEINNIDLYHVWLDTKNVQNQSQNNEVLAVKSESQETQTAENTPATKAEISKQVLADINNVISKEDVLVSNLNKSKEIYDGLSLIRTQIADIVYNLKNTDKFDDIDILMELDKRSNDTIVGIEKLLRKEEQSGLVDFNYTNIFLNGLISLKNLNISDDNYLANLENLMASVLEKEKSYKNLVEENYNKVVENGKDFEALQSMPEKLQSESSSRLQKEFILEANETLRSVSSGLTPDVVLRLLNP